MKPNIQTLNCLFALTIFFLSSAISAQEKMVRGTISDHLGQPLPGASILVKSTTNGVQSDFDGNFMINANPKDILVISYLGFVSKEIEVGDQSTINVTLTEDTSQLDEVVVVGYGTQTRNTLATSVSKLDTKILETSTRSNVGTALQGTIAGLSVVNTSGQPGSTPSIVLRGGTTFDGGGSPLILVDGVPSSFYGLNSDDIESIEVLKDAAATAIYGARSADGVILVTTKKGKIGRSSFRYNYRYSVNEKRKTADYIGGADFIKYNRQAVAYYNEASGRNNYDATFLNGPTAFGTGNNTTDSPFTVQYLTDDNRYLLNYDGWETVTDPLDPSREILFQENRFDDLIYQNSYSKDHYASFDGGNEKGTFYLGLGFLDNDGIILKSGFKRYSGKFTGSYKVRDNLEVSATVNYIHSNLSNSPLGSTDFIFRRFAGQAPTNRIYINNPDGSLSSTLSPGTNSGFGNPLYYQDKFIRKNLEQRLAVSLSLDWDPIKDLRLTVRGSHFTINNHNEAFNKAYLSGGNLNTSRNASASLERTLRNQLTGLANYKRTLGENHNLNLLLGAEIYKNNEFVFSAGTRNSPTDLITTLNAGSEANGIPTSSESDDVLTSTFGQLTYDYGQKYLLGLTFRNDGSSRLGNDKFGFFPGASFGWNLHNEEFYKETGLAKVVNNFKPRISYGVNGKVSALGLYEVYGSYGSQGIYDGQTGYGNTGLPTLDLRWERSTTLNTGLDLGLFNNRISIIGEYFVRDVKDKIADLTLPIWTGFSSITTNNGTLRNKGLELTLNARLINSENVQWNISGTYSKVRSYVQKLPENDNELNRQGGTQVYDPKVGDLVWVGGLQEGQRVGTDVVVAYVQDYIYRDQAAVDAHATREDVLLPNPTSRFPGDVAWKDLNNDNVIDYQDQKVLGRTTPDFIGGFSSSLTYKRFNFYVKTDFAVGHLVKNLGRERGLAQNQGNLNSFTELLDSWTPENRDTDVPRFVFVDYQKNILRGNSRLWEKGDYLALREVTLSYDLDTNQLKDNFLKGLKIFVTGSNLYYFKNTTTPTPELGGLRAGDFPMPVTFTLGIDITL
nr:TonB-dependent receptor [Muricauda sp. M10]